MTVSVYRRLGTAEIYSLCVYRRLGTAEIYSLCVYRRLETAEIYSLRVQEIGGECQKVVVLGFGSQEARDRRKGIKDRINEM